MVFSLPYADLNLTLSFKAVYNKTLELTIGRHRAIICIYLKIWCERTNVSYTVTVTNITKM
jgi:hypothetical protein